MSLESVPFLNFGESFHVTVTNNADNAGVEAAAQVVRNVQIKIEPPAANATSPSTQTIINYIGSYDRTTGIWTIPSIAPGDRVEAAFAATSWDPSQFDSYGAITDVTPARVSATLVHVVPNETPGFEHNNTTEQWFVYESIGTSGGRTGTIRPHVATGDVGVAATVDNRFPQAGGQATFGIKRVNRSHYAGQTHLDTSNTQVGVKVAIKVSEGLQLAPGLQPPEGTTFDNTTMIWDMGASYLTLDVPVVVTKSPSFAEVPLSRRCLTAEVVDVLPAWESDPRRRTNDVVTRCLGERPAVIYGGEVDLWWLHDCVDQTSYPCGAEDDIRLLAKADCAEPYSHGLERYCRSSGYFYRFYRDAVDGGNDVYLDPESVIIQIHDPIGRTYDGHADSVTSGSFVSWQTANVGTVGDRKGFTHHYGVALTDTQEHFAHRYFPDRKSAWQAYGPFTVTKVQNPPGHFKVRNSSNGNSWFDPMPSTVQASYTNKSWLVPFEQFVEFETLGTHVMTYRAEATRADGTTTYSDEGTYTFHVGPISELEVQDGAQDAALPRGQQAYTIFALNNGPDAAPAVEVALSGVPEGAEPMLTDGAYREVACQDGLCDAIWDLGQMPLSAGRISSGLTEFPTLTLIAPAGSTAPDISASIANTRDYSVVIDGTTYSTNYLDYYDDNDSDVIVARAGAGDPGKPSVEAQAYPQPPTAVLRWDPVERVNRWPVSHYQVWRSDASCRLPDSYDTLDRVNDAVFVDNLGPRGFDELVCYYVRAVNDLGVPGNWSAPVEVSGVQPAEPQISVRGSSPAASEGRDVTFTISAFPAPVVGESLTVGYTVGQQGDFVAAADLGQQSVTIYSDGAATITVRTTDDEVNEASGAVTVTLNNGAGYKVSSARSASVRVLDDDRPRASFASGASSHLEDEAGPHDVIVLLEPAPTADLTLRYAVGGTATRGQDYTMADYGSVTVPAGRAWVAIPVTITMDENSEPAETVELTLRAGSNYNVGDATHILTIQGNDQPEIAFSAASASVGESAGTYRAVINVEPAPHEDITIRYTINNRASTAASPGDYTISNSGTVMARRGTSRVEIPISIKDDRDNEGDETVRLILSPRSGYALANPNVFTLTITDNDGPTVSFARRSADVLENVGAHEVVINLSPAPSSNMTINYTVSGTATQGSGNDFTVPRSVTVNAGATSASIRVNINNDRVNEGDETVILTLSSGRLYSVGRQNAFWLTILDDDNTRATPVLTVCYYRDESQCDSSNYNREVHEGGQLVPSMAIHGAPLADGVKVKIQYVGGTAQPEDFTINGERPVKGKVYDAFEAYGGYRLSTRWTLDGKREGDETVIFRLVNGAGYTIEGPTDFTVTIRDRN